MKAQILSFRLLIGLTLLTSVTFFSCDEEGPAIDFSSSKIDFDTTFVDSSIPTPQAKRVLIEDFTGVRCPNCPDAQEEAESIKDDNSDRVVVLSIHPTSFASLTTPFSTSTGDQYDSQNDFRTEFGTDILTMVGVPQGLPTGTVDRKLFNGETDRTIPHGKWSGKVIEQLPLATPVNIDITNEFDAGTLELTTTIKLHYTSEVDTTLNKFLSVVIAESEVQDPQEKTGVGIISDYQHNHVLRTMLTPFSGALLKGATVQGRVFIKVFKTTLDAQWNPEKTSIIAFVNQDASNPDVVHVAEAKVK